MPNALYWSALVVVAATGLAGRILLGRPLLRHRGTPMRRADLVVAVVALLALGFHCGAMFFQSVVTTVPGTDDAIVAVRELGAVSQIAFWVPSALLLLALRRAWAPLLMVETSVLIAVGVTMFWDFGLPVHLVAIAISVAVTVALMTSVSARVNGRPVPV